eukprot:gene13420-biopygen9527
MLGGPRQAQGRVLWARGRRGGGGALGPAERVLAAVRVRGRRPVVGGARFLRGARSPWRREVCPEQRRTVPTNPSDPSDPINREIGKTERSEDQGIPLRSDGSVVADSSGNRIPPINRKNQEARRGGGACRPSSKAWTLSPSGRRTEWLRPSKRAERSVRPLDGGRLIVRTRIWLRPSIVHGRTKPLDGRSSSVARNPVPSVHRPWTLRPRDAPSVQVELRPSKLSSVRISSCVISGHHPDQLA